MLRSCFKSPFYLFTLLYIVLPAYAVFWSLGKPVIGTDDANIYFEYARNIIGGNGIVYNIGGVPVEGFSSTLYLLICVLFHLLSTTPEPLILFFNLCLAVASGIFMTLVIQGISLKMGVSDINQSLIVFAFLFWLFINPLFYGWNILSLMDSGLFLFLLIFSYAYFVRLIWNDRINEKENRWISLLILLVILARPEGAIWAGGFILIYFFLRYKKEAKPIQALKSIAFPLATWIVSILSMTIYRLLYYGYPLPNTYYTKVSPSLSFTLGNGWNYFIAFIKTYNPVILLPAAMLSFWVVIQLKKNIRTPLVYVSVVTLFFVFQGLALPVLEGGDYFGGFRFFQNVYPFLIMPYLILLLILKTERSFKTLLMNIVVVCLLLFQFNKAGWTDFYRNNNRYVAPQDKTLCISTEFNIAKYTRENGRRLNTVFKGQLPVIGTAAAGGIAVGYDGVVYDLMGLNLPKLAHADPYKTGPQSHQSFNKKVFYELSPDILMPMTEFSNRPVHLSRVRDYYSNNKSWENLIYKNIFNDDEFKQKYTLAIVLNRADPMFVCYGYFNTTYLKKLSKLDQFRIATTPL